MQKHVHTLYNSINDLKILLANFTSFDPPPPTPTQKKSEKICINLVLLFDNLNIICTLFSTFDCWFKKKTYNLMKAEVNEKSISSHAVRPKKRQDLIRLFFLLKVALSFNYCAGWPIEQCNLACNWKHAFSVEIFFKQCSLRNSQIGICLMCQQWCHQKTAKPVLLYVRGEKRKFTVLNNKRALKGP